MTARLRELLEEATPGPICESALVPLYAVQDYGYNEAVAAFAEFDDEGELTMQFQGEKANANLALYTFLVNHAPTILRLLEAVEGAERKGIFVASRVRHAETWRWWRDSAGVPIISTWIDEAGEGETGDFAELWSRITSEVLSAERVVFFASQGDPPFKGAFIEIGIALGAGIPVTVVLDQIELEPRSCRPIGSWINHPLVTMEPTLVQALATLRAAREVKP